MVVRRSATRGLWVVLSWAAGCQLVSGIPDELSLAAGTGGGAGAPPAVCSRELAPEAPAVNDVGGEAEFVVALRSVVVVQDADGVMPGLNLDGLCSCTEDDRACESLDPSNNSGLCDDGSGRDAGSTALFGGFAYVLEVTDVSGYLSQYAETGQWSVLLRIRGYSGSDEDDQVEVAWYDSPGLAAAPTWQGSDPWPVASSAVIPGLGDMHAPRFVDAAAYVTGGRLVARLPQAAVQIQGGSMAVRMELLNALVVARIEKTNVGAGYRLREGRIGGLMPVANVFTTIASFRDHKGNPICSDAPFYPAMRQISCRAVDMLLSGPPEEDTPCEALSFGVDFDTGPAALGPVAPVSPPVAGCPPETSPAAGNCNL